jgi:hypothetical protein
MPGKKMDPRMREDDGDAQMDPGDIRGATHPSLTGQHITQPYPVFKNAKP